MRLPAWLSAASLLIPVPLLALELPADVRAIPAGTTAVDLHWTPVAGAEAVVVQASANGGAWVDAALLPGDAATWRENGLAPGTLRLYRLEVRAGGGVAGRTPPVWASSGLAVAATSGPERVYAIRRPEGDIELRWEHRYADALRFRIEQAVDAGPWTPAATVGGMATRVQIADPAPFSMVQVRVRAESTTATSTWMSTFVLGEAPNRVSAVQPVIYIPDGISPTATGVTAVRTGPGSLRLSWAGSGDVVARRRGDGAWTRVATATGLTSIDLGFGAQTEPQWFAIRSAGGWSDIALLPPPELDPALPPPAEVTATPVVDGLRLDWTWHGPDPVAFVIESTRDSNQFRFAASVAGDVRPWTASGASARYASYRVSARSAAGWSAPGFPGIPEDAPTAPTSVAVTASSAVSVALSWSGAPMTYPGFAVQRAGPDGRFIEMASVDGGSWTDATVVQGRTYRYRVGVTSAGPFSPDVSVTVPLPTAPPAAPTGVVATPVSANQINLSWTQGGAVPVAGYAVSVSADGASWDAPVALPGDVRRWRIAGLAPGTPRWLRISATTPAGASAWVTVAATTGTSVPTPTVQLVTSPVGGWRLLRIEGTAADDDLRVESTTAGVVVRQGGALLGTWQRPVAEIRIAGREGQDRIRVAPEVRERVTLIGGPGDDVLEAMGSGPQVVVAVGGDRDRVAGRAGSVDIWADDPATDTVESGEGDPAERRVKHVAGFLNGASLDLAGQNIPEPGIFQNMSKTRLANQPLFATGPGPLDMHQGLLQDCPFTSTIQALAAASPDIAERMIADFGDGTYGIHVEGGYLRIDGEFSLNTVGKTPPSGLVWALVLEKAWYIHGRSDPHWAMGSTAYPASPSTDVEGLYAQARASLEARRVLQVFSREMPLLDFDSGCPSQHAHSVIGVFRDTDGAPRYVVRNPYGSHFEMASGFLDWRQGLRALTHAQMTEIFPFVSTVARSDAPPPVPVAYSAIVEVDAGGSVPIRLPGADPDARPLTWAIVEGPVRGTLTGTAPWLRYTPTGGATGSDVLRYTVAVGAQVSEPGTVTIRIRGADPANGAPQITVGPVVGPTGLVLP